MRLLFVGPPGSGKGTQCEVLSDTLGVPHISTGDLLRKASRIGGVTGRRAQRFMTAGRLVPDRLVLRILEVRLAEPDVQSRGYLLDGFPRTIAQARAFETLRSGAAFDAVVELALPRSVVLDRLAARGRTDDARHSVQRRLDIFERVTVPMVRWCSQRYPLIRIAADRPVEVVSAEILRRLREVQSGAGANPTPGSNAPGANAAATGSGNASGNGNSNGNASGNGNSNGNASGNGSATAVTPPTASVGPSASMNPGSSSASATEPDGPEPVL
jgi:adenylate kinase